MAVVYTFYDSDGATPLTTLNLSSLRPGKTLEKKLHVSPSENVENLTISFFPGLQNKTIINTDGTPVSYVKVMKQDTAGNIMKNDIAKETANGILTKKTDRIKAIFYNGSTYTDVSSGNITFPANTSEALYIGSDYIYRNLYFNQTTPDGSSGSNLVYQYYNESFTSLPGDKSDGTSGQTTPGTYFLGTITPAMWTKTKVNSSINEYKYWIKVTRTATEATPAVCDTVYWDNVFQFSYPCLFGTPSLYVKSADVTPIYTENTDYVYIYGNLGEVVYNTNPLSAGEELTSDFSYKLPEIDDHSVIFSDSSTCAVDGGSDITVVADEETDNTNIIDGINFRLYSSIVYNNSFSAKISELIKHLWYANDNYGSADTYQNLDLSLDNGGTSYFYADELYPFWIKFTPPSDMDTTENSQSISGYCYAITS